MSRIYYNTDDSEMTLDIHAEVEKVYGPGVHAITHNMARAKRMRDRVVPGDAK